MPTAFAANQQVPSFWFEFLVPDERQSRRDGTAAADRVDHVDLVVLPVRAGDAEEEREPAPEAEAALARQRPLEDELARLVPEVASLDLPYAVQEDLELARHARRQLHPRPLLHRS